MSNFKYRAEIDGLRAISVLGVIFYHANLGFPGGYIGVDVFFVISGFLISGIIMKEIDEKSFTLQSFWIRRIRRILPAVTFLVFTVFVLGILILDPISLESLGKSAVAQALMLANVFFMKSAGYFSEAAELKPLLHTWSLAVEEQFYIFFPLILILLARFKQRVLPATLFILFTLSFFLSVFALMKYPSATFYLLPTRAWELLAGSLLAILITKIRITGRFAELLSIVGIALILLPMFAYSVDTTFPGIAALPPVLGAVLFILSNSWNNNTVVGRLLSTKLIVFIGMISYSLYLWHWPLLSFAHHVFIELTMIHIFFILFFIFIFATLSWKYIETPFRNKNRLKTKTSVFVFGGILSVSIMMIGFTLFKLDGISSRFSSDTLLVMKDVHWSGSKYIGDNTSSVSKIYLGNSKQVQTDFVLWGDSHGMVVSQLIDDISNDLNISGIALLSPGRPPVTELWNPLKGSHIKEETTKINKERLNWIIDNDVKNIILVARWNVMCRGLVNTELARFPGKSQMFPMVANSNEETLSITSSTAALKKQLKDMLIKLQKHDIKVWILKQVPVATLPSVAQPFLKKYRFPLLNDLFSPKSTSKKEYLTQRLESDRVFEDMYYQNVKIIDPIESFYTKEAEIKLYAKRAYYRDENHLTRYGADIYLRKLFTKILLEIKTTN